MKQSPPRQTTGMRRSHAARSAVENWQSSLNGRTAVFQLSGVNQILLTVVGGSVSFDRFAEAKDERGNGIIEIDSEAIDKAANEIIDRIDSSSYDFDSAGSVSAATVYVSNASDAIHSIPDCSGMKNYREMSEEQAKEKGYHYCSNCW